MRLESLRWTGAGKCAVVCGIFAALWTVGCSNGKGASGGGGSVGKGGTGGISSGGGSGGTGGGSSASGGASGGTSGSGGATGTGGTSATGGAASTGGVASGGRSGTGGMASGGVLGTGGTASGGSGGTSATGGAGSGGATGTGGAAATGGTAAKGGATGTGGAATGGVSGTGGKATGGSATGGSSGTGGASATGGTTGSGACVATTAVANMKLGWNLGNSLDSADTSKSDTTVETAWGNPVVTPALIQTVASSGFGVVRIPVTWIGRFGAAPNYTISATFIARVEEVVKYVLDQGLYAIINLHHDGGEGVTGQWITLVDSSGQVTATHTADVLTQFKKIWAQIGERFKSYGDHLVFEGMNEVKVGYNTPLQSYYDQINGLNQAFVDTIRAGGGNNPTRCLVVPGYNTNIDQTVAGFVAPTDTSAGKLILSDHFYDPWSFAGSGATHAWGTGNAGIDTWGQEDWVQSEIAALKAKFIDKGLPMIWGEYGAVNQTGYENYRRYYMEYVTKATHDAGIVPILWDMGSTSSGSDAFGLVNRSSNTVSYPTIMQAMTRAVTSSYTLADIAKP